jgi:hypothetical protein
MFQLYRVQASSDIGDKVGSCAGKDLEGSGAGLFKANIPTFTRTKWEVTIKILRLRFETGTLRNKSRTILLLHNAPWQLTKSDVSVT